MLFKKTNSSNILHLISIDLVDYYIIKNQYFQYFNRI